MVPTLARPDRQVRPRQITAWLVGAVLLLVVLTPLRVLQDMPRDEITFVNRTKWDVDVDLLLDRGHSRLGLATIRANTAMTIAEIGEPGDASWTFAFKSADHVVRVTVPADDIRTGGFHVQVPDALIRELEDTNAPPSAYR